MANTILNAASCLTGTANTGVASCALDLKNIVGAILLPAGTTIPAAQLVDSPTLVSYLQTLTYAPRTLRAFPIHDFENATDNSETNTYTTLGYGGRYPTKRGWFAWEFQFVSGGFCLNLQMFKLVASNPNWDVLFVDANGVLFGQKVGTGLKGINVPLVDSPAFKINDGSKISSYSVYFSFPQDFLYSFGFVQLANGPADFNAIVGLQNVVLSEVVARASNVLNIGAVTSCGAAINLFDQYAVNLALTSAWVATDAVTGLPLTLTSVIQNASGLKAWTITVTATGNYVAGNKIVIRLTDPSILQNTPISVPGIESIPLTTAS